MFIQKVVAGPWETNAYLVGHKNDAIIIDPGYESCQQLLALSEERGAVALAIYLTHSHFDHFADVDLLKEKLGIPVYVHPEDAENLRCPGTDGLPNVFGKSGLEPDGYFVDGEERQVGELQFKVIATPGHSPGSVCFYFEKEKVLFSGDTLFRRGRGATNAINASEKQIMASLKRLMLLPEDTVVYPGHGGKTTIGEEKKWHL